MDNVNLDAFLEMLKIDSTTSSERKMAEYLASSLKTPESEVELFEVGDGTLNLMLKWGNPVIAFCTHMDTVPPYIYPSVEEIEGDVRIKGRGSCDAKGQIFSMYQACLQLAAEGHRDFALLLLSGEETGSFGAKSFRKVPDCGIEYVVVGEPTDNRFVVASKGTKSFEVTVKGKAAHSGYPEYGKSAVLVFNDLLNALESHRFAKDEVLGQTTWNIGKLVSDNPQNILSPELRFRIYFRTTFASDNEVVEYMRSIASEDISIREYGGDTPSRYYNPFQGSVDHLPECVVSFGSDAPQLTNIPHRMLYGPGSILVAHTDREFILKSDIEKAIRGYKSIYRKIKENKGNER